MILGRKKKRGLIPLILALLTCLLIAGPVSTKETFHISRELLKKAEAKYGKDAAERLISWENLIRNDTGTTDQEKLSKANNFFNETVQFVNDIELYGVKDYWATPFEFLARCAGDCEDFAIAKFFTLKAMGIKEEKLNISYVKALQYNIHHMVLTYYSRRGADPLVLDNLVDSINRASQRPDLMPIFSFNGTGLWLAKQRGRGKLTGSSSRLKAWGALLQRMAGNEL